MHIKIKIHLDLTDQMMKPEHVAGLLRRLSADIEGSTPFFVGRKILLYEDGVEVGAFKVKVA